MGNFGVAGQSPLSGRSSSSSSMRSGRVISCGSRRHVRVFLCISVGGLRFSFLGWECVVVLCAQSGNLGGLMNQYRNFGIGERDPGFLIGSVYGNANACGVR